MIEETGMVFCSEECREAFEEEEAAEKRKGQ
jgi:predicted nucleic acid-binding Zn ribbon protein